MLKRLFLTWRQPHPSPAVTESKWTWSGSMTSKSSGESAGTSGSMKGLGVFVSRKTVGVKKQTKFLILNYFDV